MDGIIDNISNLKTRKIISFIAHHNLVLKSICFNLYFLDTE